MPPLALASLPLEVVVVDVLELDELWVSVAFPLSVVAGLELASVLPAVVEASIVSMVKPLSVVVVPGALFVMASGELLPGAPPAVSGVPAAGV